MHSEEAGWCSISKIKVEVENLFLTYAKLITNDTNEHIALLQLVCHHTQQRKHVFLTA